MWHHIYSSFYFNPKYKKSIVIWEHDHLLSLAIPSFAINSLAICFTCFRPHFLSGLTCTQASLALVTLALLPHLVHLLSVSTAINDHLLSKTSSYLNTLLSKLVVFEISFLSKPVLCHFFIRKAANLCILWQSSILPSNWCTRYKIHMYIHPNSKVTMYISEMEIQDMNGSERANDSRWRNTGTSSIINTGNWMNTTWSNRKSYATHRKWRRKDNKGYWGITLSNYASWYFLNNR